MASGFVFPDLLAAFQIEAINPAVGRTHVCSATDDDWRAIDTAFGLKMPQRIAAIGPEGVNHFVLSADDHDFGRKSGACADRCAADLVGPVPDFFELFPVD